MFGRDEYEFHPGARALFRLDTSGGGRPSVYLQNPLELSSEMGVHPPGDLIHSRVGAYEPVPGALAPFDLQYGSSTRLGDLGLPDLSQWLPSTWWQWVLPVALAVAGTGLVYWLTEE